MVKTIHTMHTVAERSAMVKGPRIVDINGEKRAAYYLSKTELRDLFRKHGYNTKGITWLNYIIGWKETWGEVAPAPSCILDPEDEWNIIFAHPNNFQLSLLRKYGEDNNVMIVAVES